MFKKNIKIKAIFILLFIIVYSFIFDMNLTNKKIEIDRELNKISVKLENSFHAVKDDISIEVTSTSSIINQDKIVLQTMRKAKSTDNKTKQLLKNHLEPLYQMLQSEGVINLIFTIPSNHCFLEMQSKPNNCKSLKKDIYDEISINKTTLSGMKQNSDYISYSFLFNLSHIDNSFLGIYEVSYSVKYLQDLMLNIDNIQTDFLLQNEKFKKSNWQDKYDIINLYKKENKPFTLYNQIDEKTEVISFLPLHSINKKKTLAYLISYTDSEYIDNIITRYKNKNIILFFGLLIIFILIYKVTLHQNKIREERERFQLAIDSSSDGIWDWDIEQNHTYFSTKYKEMLGMGDDEINQSFSMIETKMHEDDKESFIKELNALLTHKQDIFECEYRVKHKDGRWVWILGRAKAQYNKKNEAIRVVGFHSDITHKKEFENKQQQLINELQEVADAKSNFLATMSHEIRTPMNAVLGFIQILQRKEDDAKKLKMLNTISDSGKSLLRIINDILDFSKMDNNKLEIENISYNIKDSFHHVKELYLSKTKEKGLKLKLYVEDRLPKETMGDKVRVEQITSNLLSNAIKFSDKNTTIEINLTYIDDSHSLKCEVKDKGIGIAKNKLKAVFETFTQEDSSTTRKYGGTGLGLSISKELCRLMGGDIWVESEVGEGSSFIFTLPLPKDIKIIEAKEDVKKTNSIVDRVNSKVLIVEDNVINQELLSMLLDEYKITSFIANDGLEAIGMLQNQDFDLVLMDENMPNMNGIEATSIIKSMPKLKDIPIVAVTANAVSGDRDKFLKAGMDDYIAKPIVTKELEIILDTYLSIEHKNKEVNI